MLFDSDAVLRHARREELASSCKEGLVKNVLEARGLERLQRARVFLPAVRFVDGGT